MAKQFHVLSLFPEYFSSPFSVSILRRAQEKNLLSIEQVNIRDFAIGKHKKVDDRPFGGGPGMVMMPGPCIDAIRSVKTPQSKTIYLSPQGSLLNAKKCEELAKEDHLIFVAGHYEGIDQRVIDEEVDEEISIGNYVLPSGCAPTVVLIEAIARFIPGVLGNEDGPYEDSFAGETAFEGPQYTRPQEYEGLQVPEVLLSGHQKNIQQWRKEQGAVKLRKMRPDLWKIKE